MTTEGLQNGLQKVPKSSKNICECGKEFSNRQNLYRHKKTCEIKPENITMSVEEKTSENNQYSGDLILELLKQNQEFKELILEQNKQMLEISKDRNITNNITQNNTNNNKFNLNVFLNETCKDALNLSEFLESLILTLTDFENFGPLGYCGGISNILVKGLNKLDINKRPIHCSDLKREVIHIKNNDTWHKDDDKQQMIKAIKAIEHKNVKQMSLWAKANPEYKDPNHKKSDLYTKLIDQSLCDTDKEKALKSYNKIIRTVAKEILVDK
jgi:CHAT domain-containing protein